MRMKGLIFFGLLGSLPLMAASPYRETVGFSYVTNTGTGSSLFLVGSHPDVSGWDPTRAVKLYWTTGNVWTGAVGVQAGTTLEYKVVVRNESAAQYCSSSNVTWMPGANLSVAVPAQPPAPYAGKTIYYHSSWTNAFVQYLSGTNWVSAGMERVGPGRSGGEFLYKASAVGEAGEVLEFVPNGWLNNTRYWDNPSYQSPLTGENNYNTSLDFIFLQDGNIYNYRPPASVSASRVITNSVTSIYEGIPSRNIRIYLPRGYDENTWKRYPVMYMHDGQNVFDPGGGFGSWSADATATREISQGRMREAILVGVNNTAARMDEYRPPGDIYQGANGIADRYANFLINNVRPTLDFNYRTLNDPANTMTLGSSLGGLVSMYLGVETNVFGKIGPVSPSFWIAPNFRTRMNSNLPANLRIYMDCGTAEGASMWDYFWPGYDQLMRGGYVPNANLLVRVGCGQGHNEPSWASRLPEALRFLLNVWDEPNRLAGAAVPPVMDEANANAGAIQFSLTTLGGWRYQVDRTDRLVPSSWQDGTNIHHETMPWSLRTLSAPANQDSVQFFRVKAY
jgi:predicted alpha/beta superfamily hydrolase